MWEFRLGNNCGLSVGPLGPTHVIIEDIGIIHSIPNITIISPSDGIEYQKAISVAPDIDSPVFLRIHRQQTIRVNKEDFKFKVGKGTILKKGKDLSLFTYSTMVSKSLEAAKILGSKGIDVEVINISTLKPVDKNLIIESSLKTKKVVTVEEHSISNGLGSIIANILIKENPVKMKMIGIEDTFVIVGQYDELINYYGLTGPKIAANIYDFVNR